MAAGVRNAKSCRAKSLRNGAQIEPGMEIDPITRAGVPEGAGAFIRAGAEPVWTGGKTSDQQLCESHTHTV